MRKNKKQIIKTFILAVSVIYIFQVLIAVCFSVLPRKTKSFVSERIAIEAYRGYGMKFGLIPFIGLLQYIPDHGIVIAKLDGQKVDEIDYDVYDDVNFEEAVLQKNDEQIEIKFPNTNSLLIRVNKES